jgi:predicted PurR-regulated permease PerM
LGVPEDFVRSTITNVSRQLVSVGQELASGILSATGTLAGGIAAALVTLIISFYLLLGWDQAVRNLKAILPETWADGFDRAVRATEHTFGAWLGGQFIASLLWGGSVVLTYFIAGLEFGLLVAVGTGLLLFIPIFGMVVGIGIPIAMAATIRIDLAIWVGLTVTLVSLAIENIVKPRVMGSTIGVSPIVILSSVILGGIAAGFWGVLFGIPIGALLWTFSRWIFLEFLQSQKRPVPSTNAPASAAEQGESADSASPLGIANEGSTKETPS